VLELPFSADRRAPLRVLCLGAHSDDLEIGCGGTILRLVDAYPNASFRWIVLSAAGERQAEALAGAACFLAGAGAREVVVQTFRESFFPFAGERIKELFEGLKVGAAPDLVLTHYRHDLHQDHKLVSDLTWNTFRQSLILEYEVPKWDGDLGAPNCFVRLPAALVERKIRAICDTFSSQRGKAWFTPDTFRALMRLRGIEANAQFAEAFYARKVAVG
jgi:LmbE family N-acetylglucosaminyl deacetylase